MKKGVQKYFVALLSITIAVGFLSYLDKSPFAYAETTISSVDAQKAALEAELAKLEAEKRYIQNFSKSIQKVRVFIELDDKSMITLTSLDHFPFSLETEIQILLADAITQYNLIITEYKKQQYEHEKTRN